MKNHSQTSSVTSRAALSAAAIAITVALTNTAVAQSSTPGAGTDYPSSSSGAGSDRSTTSSPSSGSTTSKSSMSDSDSQKFIHKAARSGLLEVRLSQLAVGRTANPSVRTFGQMIINDHQKANAALASIANRRGILIPLDSASASMRMHGEPAGSSAGSTGTATSSSPAGGTSRDSTAPRDPSTSRDTATTSRDATTAGQASSSASPSARGTDTRGTATQGTAGTSAGATSAGMSPDSGKLLEEVEKEVQSLSRASAADFDREYLEHMIKGHKEAIDLFEEQGKRNDPELSEFARSKLPTLRAHLEQAQTVAREVKR